MNEIRVLLVDDHAELRAELRRLVASQSDLRLVAEAGGAREAVRLTLEEMPTVVVMDLSLPDGDGITATAEIVRARPEVCAGIEPARGYGARGADAGGGGARLCAQTQHCR